jgi:hypothetical protein
MKNFSTQNQPVAANEGRIDRPFPAPPTEAAPNASLRPRRRFMLVSLGLGMVVSLFWVGIYAAFLWGYLGPDRLTHLPLQSVVELAAAMALPPLLFIAIAILIARGLA